MILDKDYAINIRTGNILGDETITVKCDCCGSEWYSKYVNYKSYRKKKNITQDLCRICRHPHNSMKGIKKYKRTEIKCSNCGKLFKRRYRKKRISFCSNECSAQYKVNNNFHKFESCYLNMDDEVAYLIGAILGDGTISKSRSKNSLVSKIAIYCNSKDKEVLELLIQVLDSLNIPYASAVNRTNCVAVIFDLPKNILKEWGLDFYGSKFIAQPVPKDIYVRNINFAVGLINSDGYVALRSRGYRTIHFASVTKSIVIAMKKCLLINDIKFHEYEKKPQMENWKKQFLVNIDNQNDIEKINILTKIKLKECRNIN